jgi:hypothetical protein
MMGADDVLFPHFLEIFVKRFNEEQEIDIYQPGVQVIDENDQVYLPLIDRIKRWIMPKRTVGFLLLRLSLKLIGK